MDSRRKILLIGSIACLTTAATANTITTPSQPKTFLGPSLQLSATKGLSENTAFSVLGEGGPRNMRVGGTLGWGMTYYQRLKMSAELLRQKITYQFYDGPQHPWVSQVALGIDYQYDFHETAPIDTQFDVAGYVSHAPSKNLGVASSSAYITGRRIAGSTAVGVSPGVTVSPWYGTSVTMRLNYDSIRYNTVNRSSANTRGWGGTVGLTQMISDDVNLNLSASRRQPFNDYQADIAWGNIPYYGMWTFKVFGEYTVGKNSLPSTYNVGIGADYLIGTPERQSAPVRQMPVKSRAVYKDRVYKDAVYKDQIIPPVEWNEDDNINQDLLKWTSIPAVRMPRVITITDENLCVAPTKLADIPDQGTIVFPPYTFDVSPYFSGTNLTYTVNGAPVGNGSISGSIVSINNSTGDLVGISITASNSCGSVTSNNFTAFT